MVMRVVSRVAFCLVGRISHSWGCSSQGKKEHEGNEKVHGSVENDLCTGKNVCS